MHVIFLVLGIIALLGGLACSIIILIEAFKDEIWKGIVCLICGLYFLYFAIFEFDHENKWLIVLASLGGSAIAAGCFGMAGGFAAPTPPG